MFLATSFFWKMTERKKKRKNKTDKHRKRLLILVLPSSTKLAAARPASVPEVKRGARSTIAGMPDQHHHSGYSPLLNQAVWARQQANDRTGESSSKSWLGAAKMQPSWTGERPPTRKLVKDMNGSGRPSSSIELSGGSGEEKKGILRRQIAKLKGLYRKKSDDGL
jgi:hypothetical protein